MCVNNYDYESFEKTLKSILKMNYKTFSKKIRNIDNIYYKKDDAFNNLKKSLL